MLISLLALVLTLAGSTSARPTAPALRIASLPRTPVGVTLEPGLTLGLANSAFELGAGAAASQRQWAWRARRETAEVVRVDVIWRNIAPSVRPAGFSARDPNSPGYDWSALDEMVRSITADGAQVLLTTYDAPDWAERSPVPTWASPGTWEPEPNPFADFATALARRYSGHWEPPGSALPLPRVALYQGWNEPNLYSYLNPQWEGPRGRMTEASPNIYRGLLNAFYGAVKAVSPRNLVLAAGTAPFGDPIGGVPLPLARTAPVIFDRDLFCLSGEDRPLPCHAPVHLDAIDDHPYGTNPFFHALEPDDVAVPDQGKLSVLLNDAVASGTVLPRGPKARWITEVTYDTNPPARSGVSLAKDARWVEETEYEFWAQGISTMLWFGLGDAGEPDVFAQSGGLYFVSGAAKPAAQTFRFPLLEIGSSASGMTLWCRSPSNGKMLIQRLKARRWVNVSRFPVRADEVFEDRLKVPRDSVLRAAVAGETSAPAVDFDVNAVSLRAGS